MKVTLYTREGCEECVRVLKMLSPISAREDFELVEAPSPEGAPAPCIRFAAPGSPFYSADNLTEPQFLAYLQNAQESQAAKPAKPKRKPGTLPDSNYEQKHPVRSFLWRHRVGGLISGLSLFLCAAWIAPLTVSLGLGDGFYNAVHRVYQLVCDQVPERSAQINGLSVCLCWRCTAIYSGSLIFGILYTLARDGKLNSLKWLTKPVSLIVMLLFGLPLILDGASHAIGLRTGIEYAYSSDFWLSWSPLSFDWWLRIGTSLLATVGAVKFLCPRMDKMGSVYERLRSARLSQQNSPELSVSQNPLSTV